MGFSRQECWSGVPLPSPSEAISLALKVRQSIHSFNKHSLGGSALSEDYRDKCISDQIKFPVLTKLIFWRKKVIDNKQRKINTVYCINKIVVQNNDYLEEVLM